MKEEFIKTVVLDKSDVPASIRNDDSPKSQPPQRPEPESKDDKPPSNTNGQAWLS